MDEVLSALRKASTAIYREIQNHAGLTGIPLASVAHEAAKDTSGIQKKNTSGDKVLALDEIADACVERALRDCPLVSGFASEEREQFVAIEENATTGKYIVVYDPLDGSQNVAPGLSVGAIFGVFEATHLEDVKTGNDIVGAAYAQFSASLLFVSAKASTDTVPIEQYDFLHETWRIVVPSHRMPNTGKVYAINEGNSGTWDPVVAEFVKTHLRNQRSVRWMCCMVSDVHRQLLQGGCFLYPADEKYPTGRLRLLYEAVPLAFIWEKAGGGAAWLNSNGDRILDHELHASDVHKKCGVVLLGQHEKDCFDDARMTVQQ